MIDDLWYKNGVFYCLSVGTYMDANGDGVGDFKGLLRRLDYLHGLGITAIWLMPFQPSPGRDDGYDISDYYGVDPRYGTLGDFVEFTHGCKQRGIRVIIDLVVNHTSDQHAWFREARRDRDSPYRDWYVWSDKKPANANTGMVFPGVQKSTWTRDKEAGAWYFHRFYDFQPDLNTSNPHVQAEILKIMGFWIQLGVSGFRMDAVPFVIATKGAKVRKPVEQYDMLRSFREFLQWRQGNAIILAEANVLPETDMEYFGRDGDRMHMMFNFHVNQHLFYALASADTRPLAKVAGGDQAAAGHRAMGPVPAQPRRTRSRPPDQGAARCRVQGLRSRQEHAALRPRHPPPAGADAGRRPAAARTCLQPDVHAAGDARDPLRRRNRHGRQSRSARAQLRAHADAVVDRAACRLHRKRQAVLARDRQGALRLRARQRRQAAPRSQLDAELDRAHHPDAQGSPGSRLGRFQGDRNARSGRAGDPLRLAQQLGAVRA